VFSRTPQTFLREDTTTMKCPSKTNCIVAAVTVLLMLIVLECALRIMEDHHLINLTMDCKRDIRSAIDTKAHPYLGFMTEDGTGDNYYFIDSRVYVPQKDEVTIGIFGGSVATNLALGMHTHRRFYDAIQPLTKKKIKILNFANAAFKQPQSLLALAYAYAKGQKLDYILLLDGFNEIFCTQLNEEVGIPYDYPDAVIFAPLIALSGKGSQNQSYMENYTSITRKMHFYEELCRTPSPQALALVKVAKKSLAAVVAWSAKRDFNRFYNFTNVDTKDGIFYIPPVQHTDIFKKSAELWKNAAVAMRILGTAYGAKMFHYIQPNQYYSKHHFSEHERAIAFVQKEGRAESIRKGYDAMMTSAAQLNAAGNKVIPLVDLYDDVKEEVYVDNCCHYNKRGEEILQDRIAKDLAADINATSQHEATTTPAAAN